MSKNQEGEKQIAKEICDWLTSQREYDQETLNLISAWIVKNLPRILKEYCVFQGSQPNQVLAFETFHAELLIWIGSSLTTEFLPTLEIARGGVGTVH